ncbi:MAG: N-acetylmuramoyl-L-alanine amidase [Rickettsiales bacterium]|nr:N-acetylmuramoyl-L-alanine amidase [Verrucomicrobiaceae bacterium]MBV63570.1 N-acetylmuramoyl-L-alanine amidase [Rickettsiales bacterium]
MLNYKNIRRSFFLTLALIVSIASEEILAKTVIIDPGHGGKDKGAYWYGISEKTLTLDVAKKVETLLRNRGIKVLMTRKSDHYVSIQDRASIANKYSNAIFVSIHFNAHTNSSVKGIETFYLSSRGKKLASSIQSRLARRINTNDRGSKKYHYAVLRKTKGVAALVECGFISNRWEGNRCASSWYKEILAQEITEGITAYCNNN